MKIQKAAIAIDNWKLQIFERHLKNKGYVINTTNGLMKGVMVLSVETENLEALAHVVKAANTEAAKTGEHE